MKVNGIEIMGDCFAYDGCHKIYICESLNDIRDAMEKGYEVHDIEELPAYWEKSCPLRFINSWDLTTIYVDQCEKAKFDTM